MSAVVAALSRDLTRKLRTLLAPWPRRKWPLLVVTVAPEGLRVLSRAALAHELRAGDLEALAHEATERHAPDGAILTYVVADTDQGAAVAFSVVGLR